MAEFLQAWTARVPSARAEELLEVWPRAITEAQGLCPELLGAELVRLDDDVWLEMVRWSALDGEERLMKHADRFEVIPKLHELLGDDDYLGRGEIVGSIARLQLGEVG